MKKFAFLLSILFLLFLFTASAYALPTAQIRISDGVTTVTLTDNALGDGLAQEGAILFSGTVGNFIINVETGLSKPILGAASLPHMDLSSSNTSVGTGGTLTVEFSDTGFTGVVPGFLTKVGGTAGGTFQLDTYLDNSNAIFFIWTNLSTLGPFGAGAFSGESSASATPVSPYSLTFMATINHGPSVTGTVTSFDAELTAVPEPATMLLSGLGLLSLGVYLRRRSKKA